MLWRPLSVIHARIDPDDRILTVAGVRDDDVELSELPWPRINCHGKLDGGVPLGTVKTTRKELRNWYMGVIKRLPGTPVDLYRLGQSFAARPVVGGRSSDDSVLSSFSQPPISVADLDRAKSSTFYPCAWRVWQAWRGDVDLVTYLARVLDRVAADEQYSGAGDKASEMAIAVYVLGDVERFSSWKDMRSNLTRQAAEKLSTVEMRSSSGPLTVELTFARRRRRGAISKVVFLEVSGSPGNDVERVAAVRDRISIAVRRGVPRLVRQEFAGEGLRERVDPGHTMERPGHPERRIYPQPRWMTAALLAVGSSVVLLWVVSPVVSTFGHDAVEPLALATAGIGVLIGGIVALLPGVDITATPRSARVGAALKALQGGAIGLLFGLARSALESLIK